MTINTTIFTDWARKPRSELARWSRASPAIRSLRDGLLGRYPGAVSLGDYGVRNSRGSDELSVHSFGSALDLSYRGLTRTHGLDMMEFVIANSDELDVQAVHDYLGGRIWRSVRGAAGTGGWRTQTPNPRTGMGQSWGDWLHFEVHEPGWHDGRPMAVKLGTTRPSAVIGSGGEHVKAAQAILVERAGQDIGPIDGWWGPRTAAGWRNVQAWCKWPRVDDDIVGDDWDLLAWIDRGWDRLNAAGVR
jgi:hypothetical protein